MINTKYNIDNFIDPRLTYNKLSDKIKIGQPIFNKLNEKIEKVDLRILQEILKFESGERKAQKYTLINLTDKWLLQVFAFESRYITPQAMTVFTSKIHGLKIHKTQYNYSIGYTIREKINAGRFSGTHNFKPRVITVNELMDHLYLIKREEFDFSKDDMEYINATILKDLNYD